MFFHAHSLRLLYSMPIQNQFAKPPLRGFPFAHVWLLAIYMFKNMLNYASIYRIFIKHVHGSEYLQKICFT